MRTKEFNNAAARLIYDIVGADGYVSDRELDIMDSLLNEKYNLNDSERAFQASQISFCKALKILQNWKDQEDIDELLEELFLLAGVGSQKYKNKGFTKIEGHCSLYEAWLLFSIVSAIKDGAKVFSTNKSDYRFSKSEIIYVENISNSNNELHLEMQNRYEEFKSKLELHGIRLIYLPKIGEYFKERRKHRKLYSLMRYVNPFKKYEDCDAQKIVDNIDRITTSEFTKALIPESGEIYKELKPSFLLKVITSSVIDNVSGKTIKESNFILIPIKGTISSTLDDAIKKYSQYTLDIHIPERKLHERPFMLHGFDRTFLNFAMVHFLNSDRLIKVVFDFSRNKDFSQFPNKKIVRFVFDGERNVLCPFENKAMVIYFLTSIFSLFYKGLPLQEDIRRRKRTYAHEILFNLIYKKVKGEEGCLYNGKGKLDTELTRLKQYLNDVPKEYWPVRDDCFLKLSLGKKLVYLKLKGEEFQLEQKIEELMGKYNFKAYEDAMIKLLE